MKKDDLTPQQKESVAEFLESRQQSYSCLAKDLEGRVLNYLFTINAGGLAGAAAYLAAKPVSAKLMAVVVCFSVGLVAVVVATAWGFYRGRTMKSEFENDLSEWHLGKLELGMLQDRDSIRCRPRIQGHLLGLLSGVGFLAGLVIGCIALSSASS
jgi:hypothetical protein